MTEREKFLSRWLRRKSEAAEAEAELEATKPSGSDGDQPDAVETEATRASDQPPATAEPAGPLALDDLPPLESITAQTDIRAFLAPGVPPELRLEALRRAWSADPAIRDFVGLSENLGDFNTPGAIPGFGPLEMTDDLRRMVAQLFTPAPQEAPRASDADPALQREPGRSAPAPLEGLENLQVDSEEQDEIVRDLEESLARARLSRGLASNAAAQPESRQEFEGPSTARRSHGGALPK